MEQTFTEWYEKNSEEGDLCTPPMTNEEFENFIVKYLLDDDFCVDLSMSDKQARTILLTTILSLYSENFRKEIKSHKYES